MSTKFKLLTFFIILILGAILNFYILKDQQKVINKITPKPTVVSIVNKKASFLIFTNGTKRIFTDSKYHNKSEDVFITSENPSIINIRKEYITWGDFFKSLPSPMKVEKTCLHTGTGQTFCNDHSNSLKFYLNGKLEENILEKQINSGDKLLISFGPAEDPEIKNQLLNFP